MCASWHLTPNAEGGRLSSWIIASRAVGCSMGALRRTLRKARPEIPMASRWQRRRNDCIAGVEHTGTSTASASPSSSPSVGRPDLLAPCISCSSSCTSRALVCLAPGVPRFSPSPESPLASAISTQNAWSVDRSSRTNGPLDVLASSSSFVTVFEVHPTSRLAPQSPRTLTSSPSVASCIWQQTEASSCRRRCDSRLYDRTRPMILLTSCCVTPLIAAG